MAGLVAYSYCLWHTVSTHILSYIVVSTAWYGYRLDHITLLPSSLSQTIFTCILSVMVTQCSQLSMMEIQMKYFWWSSGPQS